jgi:hypothetical protein
MAVFIYQSAATCNTPRLASMQTVRVCWTHPLLAITENVLL